MAESYHTRRIFSPVDFSFAMDMLNAYPWISRPMHRRGFALSPRIVQYIFFLIIL